MNTNMFDGAAVGARRMQRKSGRDDDVSDVTSGLKHISDEVGRFCEKSSERIQEIGERLQDVEQKLAKASKPFASAADPRQPLFDAGALAADPDFKNLQRAQKGASINIALSHSIKSLVNLTTEANSAASTIPTNPDRAPGFYGIALRRLSLLDLLPSRQVVSNATEFVQLNFAGDANVQVDEGDVKAETEFSGLLKIAPVATVAVHTTTSAQVLDDNDSLQSELQRIMGHSVLSKVESQLLVGSGLTGHIDGLYTQATAITTYENQVADRIGSALVQMDILGYQPNVILMHPSDWFAIQILKDADGGYLYGSPSSPAQPTLWNLPVITSPSIPQGTALVGDTQQATMTDRMQPTIFLSRDHLDYRTRNLVLILVEARVGLELYDALAFRRVDLAAAT
jgi:HK97 family phage major capsid protein